MYLLNRILILLLLAIWGITGILCPSTGHAKATLDQEEILLTFRYQAVGHVYVTGLYDYRTDRIYLPVVELFSLLMVNVSADRGSFSVNGFFLDEQRPYFIDFANHRIAFGGNRPETFAAEHFVIGETDFFLSPDLFAEIFELDFEPDVFRLTLQLLTRHTMPVVENLQRARARNRIEEMEGGRFYHPLEYPVRRPVLATGFVDYSLSGNGNSNNQSYSYTLDGGIGLLGGGLRVSYRGVYNNDVLMGQLTNIHWYYGRPDATPLGIHRLEIGDLSTSGLNARRIQGIALSNDPVEPRYAFGTFRKDGTAEPDADVELYLNNNLVQYVRADKVGYYLFDIPITYGFNSLEIVIYNKDGSIRRLPQQLNKPFQFQPAGAFVYRVDAGRLDEVQLPGLSQRYAGSTLFTYGLNQWLTVRTGSEFISDELEDPFLFGGLSTRLGSFLIDTDIAPGTYYQTNLSVIFPSRAGVNARFRYYDGSTSFNTRNADYEAQLGLTIPLSFAGFRVQSTHTQFGSLHINDINTDVSVRLLGINTRVNYRTRISLVEDELNVLSGFFRFSAGYMLRTPWLPFLNRSNIRVNASYDADRATWRDVDAQFSRRLFENGNLQVTAIRNIPSQRTLFTVGLNFNLGSIARYAGSMSVDNNRNWTANSAIRGSVGFDDNFNYVQFANRNQVSRGGASVVMFVDRNNSGTFDEGDELLPFNAVRVDRMGGGRVGRDGIVRVTQLQSFYRYNMTINERMIPDPTLRPAREAFSFIADPNQFKRIEIPFYKTGIAEGQVLIAGPAGMRPQGGIRVDVIGLDNSFRETVRTFHSGEFYSENIPPGRYKLEVSLAQLDLLGVVPGEPLYTFEIRGTSEGDYVGGLEILLIPRPAAEERPVLADLRSSQTLQTLSALRQVMQTETRAEQTLQLRQRNALRSLTFAQQAFYSGQFESALEFIEDSLEIFPSDYGTALKGSILYVMGRQEEGMALWELANIRNPSIDIPDPEQLDLFLFQLNP